MTTERPPRSEEKKDAILRYLTRYQTENGYSPSQREIRDACSFSSTSIVNYHLNILEHHGYIVRPRHIARAIIITPKGQEYAATPA